MILCQCISSSKTCKYRFREHRINGIKKSEQSIGGVTWFIRSIVDIQISNFRVETGRDK